MVLGDWTAVYKKNETRAPTYTIHKNKLKVDKRLKYIPYTMKVLEETIGRKISNSPSSNIFIDMSPRARDINEKNK